MALQLPTVVIVALTLVPSAAAAEENLLERTFSTTDYSVAEKDALTRYTLQCESINPRTLEADFPEIEGRKVTALRCDLSYVTLKRYALFAGRPGAEGVQREQIAQVAKALGGSVKIRKDAAASGRRQRSDLERRHHDDLLSFALLVEEGKEDAAWEFFRSRTQSKCELGSHRNSAPSSGGIIFRRRDENTWISDGQEVNCRGPGDDRPNPELKGRQVFLLKRKSRAEHFDLVEKTCGQPDLVWGRGQEASVDKTPPFKCDTIRF